MNRQVIAGPDGDIGCLSVPMTSGGAATWSGLGSPGLWPWPARSGRRIGGMTGDVFGAQIELATAAVLVTLALTT